LLYSVLRGLTLISKEYSAPCQAIKT